MDIEGNPLTWKTNWASKEPKNKTKDQDCGIVKPKSGSKFAALKCSSSAHAVCRFESPVRYEMRGVCATEYVDTQYTAYNSTHLMGDSLTWIMDNKEYNVSFSFVHVLILLYLIFLS